MWEIIGLTFISTTVQIYVGDYRFDLYFYDCPDICEIIGLTFISTTVQIYVGDYRFDLYFYDCPDICGRLSV